MPSIKAWSMKALWRVCILAMGCLVGCDDCSGAARRDTGAAPRIGMCGKCDRSSDCKPGLSCVNGTCETAPPSCHVKIGL